LTGALVSTNGDPDDPAPAVGFWACTGASVLTSVPVVPDAPDPLPLPESLTGALVLINGDREDPCPDVGFWACTGALMLTTVPVVEPLPVPPAGAGLDMAVALSAAGAVELC